MKVLSEPPFQALVPDSAASNELILPQGILGFEDYRRAELLYSEENLPFLWMRLHGPDILHFVVMEPANMVPGYEPEIFDEDAAQLEIREAADAMILNIVTLKHNQPTGATINLIGPIIVNRRTRIARQRVISNHGRYSSHHPLVDNSRPVAAGRAN
jgi:flagellar assembly factor FliW